MLSYFCSGGGGGGGGGRRRAAAVVADGGGGGDYGIDHDGNYINVQMTICRVLLQDLPREILYFFSDIL